MIRTVLFDLGNVLLYFSHERMFAQMGALCEHTGEAVRELLLTSGTYVDLECGRLSRPEFHRRFQQLTGHAMDRRKLMRAVSDIFTPNESILPVLDELKASGHRLVLLSNTNAAHVAFIQERFDVLTRFDECVLSYEVGAMKPDPPMFEAALRAIQCEPMECFYTDDVGEYVERARGYGLQAEVFIDTRTLLAHLQACNVRLPSRSRN